MSFDWLKSVELVGAKWLQLPATSFKDQHHLVPVGSLLHCNHSNCWNTVINFVTEHSAYSDTEFDLCILTALGIL